MNNDLLNITNLNVKFMINQNVIEVLKDINISIEKQDTVAIIGESGSGKTILAKTICGILPNNLYEICGKINYNGEDINLKQGINKKYVSIVLQNPMQSFSETVKIKNFMNDVFKANKIHEEDDNIKIKILKEMEIKNPKDVLKKYSYELSGGMLQRIALGIMLEKKPEILICDEVTSSLDVITQRNIVNLILKEKKKQRFTLLFITHDISLVEEFCNKVIIIKNGEIIEQGKREEILKYPQSLYTKNLIMNANINK